MTVGVFGERAAISETRHRFYSECGEHMRHFRGFVNLSNADTMA